jgi:hypothetical protein
LVISDKLGTPLPLPYQAKPDEGEMMIEGVGKSNFGSLHNHKAGGIDGRQLA